MNPAVRELVESGSSLIHELMDKGVRFDTDEDNSLSLGMEGAHRQKRIVHCGGDATGKYRDGSSHRFTEIGY